jgi:ATP-dependent 26S proteasome regulatory subunit
VLSVVGLLKDDIDPMVNVMRVDKAPLESYADIGGLDKQIQEVKVSCIFLISLCFASSLNRCMTGSC